MHYQTNKANKLIKKNTISEHFQYNSQKYLSNTLPPKTSKQENFIQTENSENTINNINPLSKSKDSNSNRQNYSQYNLFSAVEYNDLEKAEQILKNDPSQLNELNDEGISPLHISVIKANLKMIHLLLQYGANSNILSERKKQTPLHLAYLNQNSMTEEILQELKNFYAKDNIYDINNKKPSDYLNNSFLKKNNTDDYSSSAKKREIQSNNTVLLITNENHFDSFMTTNKEDDNKSNINSTINNNNTIQTPSKLEGSNINEDDSNNERNLSVNSNNKYNTNNTNNTINSKSDSFNRRQYTFGKEEDYIKFQSKNSDININLNNNNNNISNNSNIKNMDINYNNINKNNNKDNNINNKDNNDFLQNIINAEKMKQKEKQISPSISPNKIEPIKIEENSKNELNDSLEEECIITNKSKNKNNRINKNRNKFYLNNINIYENDNSPSYKSSEKSNYNITNTNNTNNNIYNLDSFTKNNGLISNSMLTYTDSMNNNGSTPQSKKLNVQETISNSVISNLKDNIDEIEVKLPHTTYNNINVFDNENNNNNNKINNMNNNIKIDDININPNSNLNMDDFYKRIIIKKRDSIMKSHRNCYSGVSKYERKNIDNSNYNIENCNILNKNSLINSQNSNKNSENTNMNRTVIHNTSKDNNSSFRNITVIHNNNMNGICDGNNSYYKDKETSDNNISTFTTKSQSNKLKPNGLTNNMNEKVININSKNNNIIHSRNNNNNNTSNNNSFLTNNINNSELNNYSTHNNKNISEFKYMDNSTNNINNNYINNSNNNSNININELINEDASNQSKNVLSSLKYWLNNIELINYYQNFINNSIIDISLLVEKMKSYQTKLKYENIESILKIKKPGHIYRILCRLEVDANLIDNKVTKFLLKNSKIFNKEDFYLAGAFDNNGNNNNLHLLISQDYQCLGCCKTNKQFSNMVKNDLKSFLKRYGLLNYYQNFYHNGFELIEYVILQMYGGYPINDDILENCFHVYDEEMRKKILKAIVSEMKKINEFLVSEEYNSYDNLDLIKYENIVFSNDNKNNEESKIMINDGKNTNCNIF